MSKIILAQIDTTIGSIKKNSEKIITCIKKAKQDNADIIIFPQDVLIGYPTKNILNRHKYLLDIQKTELENICKETANITAIVGHAKPDGGKSFSVFKNQEKISTDTISLDNEEYKIISGEYDILTSAKQNIIHLSASSSRNGKEYLKNKHILNLVKAANINYIYVNSVGYNDNIVFDGTSRIYDKSGKITARAKSFEEDYLITENLSGRIEKLPDGSDKEYPETFSLDYENDLDRLYNELICGVKGYFNKNGFKKAVLGLSGGLDSTICAVLLADALGKENVIGVSMPTKISSQGSKDDARELAQNLGITYIEAPISNEIDVFKNELNEIFSKIKADKYQTSTTFENIQARTRATLLWSISNEFKEMLSIATSDKSESYIGYATTNGDMSGGFAPIADVTKTKLFALGAYLNKTRQTKNVIPKSILEKAPGAELKYDKAKGRTITAEEDNMPYPFLDEVIFYIETFGLGFNELMSKEFLYEKCHHITVEQKKEWLNKFYKKHKAAVFKWHLMPPSIITDRKTINQSEYYHPIV